MQRILSFGLLAVMLCILTGCATPTVAASSTQPLVRRTTERVLALGGSVAEGHLALHNDGYLQRAFQALTDHTTTTYRLFDKAITGANSTQMGTIYKGQYTSWINQFHPQVIVLSWGLINDSLPNTPVPTFDYWLKHEIHVALAAHAIVLIITPPVTQVAYTQFKASMQGYVNDEIRVVRQLHNANVKLLNLFDQMKAYIAAHHQSYTIYVGDPHHPNTRGHILGGQILYHDMTSMFKNAPIRYTP